MRNLDIYYAEKQSFPTHEEKTVITKGRIDQLKEEIDH